MPERYYLKGRAPNHGAPVHYSGSHKSVDEALIEAEKAIAARGEIVWIVDEEGLLVLPADQVRVRLNPHNASPNSSPQI